MDELTRFLIAIGRVTVNFARLDLCVDSALGLLLFGNDSSKQDLGRAVTSELSFKQKVWMLESLVKQISPASSDEASQLCSKLFSLEGERNQITHSSWAGVGAGIDPLRIKPTAKGELKHGMKPHPIEQIEDLASRISKTSDAAILFGFSLLQEFD